MNAVTAARNPSEAKRRRELVTPEGLSLPLTLASKGARAGALMLDLALIFLGLVVFSLILAALGIGISQVEGEQVAPGIEVVLVLVILLLFLARYGYFLWFEIGPRGATPGKRALGIRVAARGGGRLTAEAVIARNLMRDVEVFVPLVFLLSGGASGVAGIAAGVWLAIFVLFPFFNRDALRAGDLIAGTWVVEAERRKLPQALSLTPRTPGTYRFGEAELSVYGEHELQVLEGVLRHDNAEAQRKVVEAICRKIGWEPGHGDDRQFLEAFYEALRARLESGMRFGKRKKDKFDR
ncbi:RDD family protein [Croceibacterium selenioxidans]